MIPILYESKRNDDIYYEYRGIDYYDTNGIGFLSDCLECTVTEERNGVYECEFSYPASGQLANQISVDRIIKVKANDKSVPQLFRIYKISKTIDQIIKCTCLHISYDLNGYAVTAFYSHAAEGITATQAFDSLKNKIVGISRDEQDILFDYTFETDIETKRSTFNIPIPSSFRKCLLGMEGSILDNFHGEYEFDNRRIILHKERGQDNGVKIIYGKNMTDMTSDVDVENVYTAIVPYATQNNITYTGGNNTIKLLDSFANYGAPRCLIVDLSDKFATEEVPSYTRLMELAEDYIKQNKIDEISQNITVSFDDFMQSKEYKTFGMFESVCLCDVVTIYHPNLGISASAKVVKTVYDSLTEKYTSIEIGQPKGNLGNVLLDIETDISKIQNKTSSTNEG